MRSSIPALLALNFSLAATTACDDDLAAHDSGGWADDAVSFRECLPPECTTNSPFVGDFPFSNIRTKRNASADTPVVGVSAYSRWNQGTFQKADYSWMSFDYLLPTAEGRLYAYDSATNTAEAIDQGRQVFFALSIYDNSVNPPTNNTVALWIKDVTTSSPAPGFDAWKYTIATKVTPPSSDFPSVGSPADVPPTTGPNPWSGTYYSICPASDDESGEALILQYSKLKFDGDAAWLEDGFELGPVNLESPSISVIACQGHAFSKPQEFLGITPNSYVDANFPGERSYGLDNYTAAADAYRAFFDGESRTVLGTPVYFKDLRHNPPWFDQTTSAYLPPPPIIGSWQFILESVYKDVDSFGDPLGATCYYTDANFPSGAHRLYDPPAGNANLPGWSSMPSCGAAQSNWDDFGPIGAFVLKHVIPAPPAS
ncbi:hypothetical protein OV203_06270 [Nannocystis sp. ILAH1]|uniref:hypothetical protein n=1 Tax=Nannocystis sp. ILAH1 TaxID=2996789 RepID=UPI00226E701F|nr:hypothetical protein [Nannocystis sp. ILAH1]MCY0986716.1 hypothetical protein [Nannocystis sp. ILAH1]